MPALRTVRLLNQGQALDEPDADVFRRAARTLGLAPDDLRGARFARRSLDARRRGGGPRFVCHVDLVVDARRRSQALSRALRSGRAQLAPRKGELRVTGLRWGSGGAPRVVVIGSGPAGFYAAWVLAHSGARVKVVDRGARIDERGRDVARFRRTRTPNPESNLLFGEGGAGTYSDGKIYTRVDDELEVPILETLVAAGAPQEILFDSRAHIGTDRLHRILPRLRDELEALGVEFLWGTRFERLVVADGGRRVRAVRTSAGELPCDALVLAPGHSARDTWRALQADGVAFESKPFQLGVRVEHPQATIDRARYPDAGLAARVGAASYQLVCRREGALPAVHSFCMCPGGRIVASVSEPGYLCTNGMSNSTHSHPYANAALVVTLDPDHWGGAPFEGVRLQRRLERESFLAGGGDYTAPAQGVPDFLAGRRPTAVPRTSYAFGTRPEPLHERLPAFLVDALRRGLDEFGRRLEGFDGREGVLVGIESRSSSPVRIPRDDETRLARGFENLYPVGEGAGYAGGIMSAALDGAHAARALLTEQAAAGASGGLHPGSAGGTP